MAKWIVALFLAGVMSGCSQFASQTTPTPSEEGEWLTARLVREGDLLIFRGPNLSNQVGQGKLYTYYDRGVWVALLFEGYDRTTGENTWRITPELKAEKPDWETNENWSVDFWWPASRGAFPEGALPGTSSK
jgi:hypothetical protein